MWKLWDFGNQKQDTVYIRKSSKKTEVIKIAINNLLKIESFSYLSLFFKLKVNVPERPFNLILHILINHSNVSLCNSTIGSSILVGKKLNSGIFI